MRVKLVMLGGNKRVVEIPLSLPAVLGRGRQVNLALPHSLVSRQHCELFEEGGKLMVRDLGSLNGTYVGSERVSVAEVPHGDLISIGPVTFRAVYLDNGYGDPDSTTHCGSGNDSSPLPAGGCETAAAVADRIELVAGSDLGPTPPADPRRSADADVSPAPTRTTDTALLRSEFVRSTRYPAGADPGAAREKLVD